MDIGDEEDDEQSFIDLADFEVIPRPQELINVQLKSSASKSETVKHKSEGSSIFKLSSHQKDAKKVKDKSSSKERGLISKSSKKSNSKAKSTRKTSNSEATKALEMEKKYRLSCVKSVLKKKLGSALDVLEKRYKTAGPESSEKSASEITSPEIDNLHGQELLKIIEEPAISDQEKLNVLNARDDFIRLRKHRGSRVTKVIGCCPDMCPEKERYNRIVKNCLSVLEMKIALNPNTTARDADHRFMVKEYSRSSADQQEPLPHELRPVSVLMMTMNYLICNIMDLKSDNVSLRDWYDFIWNRTRSIRKDITQQQFCDIDCVGIIEKCVRFHIHCAAALSEEETSTFDPKINNENLNKCLQTLKHMYHDLQSKGIDCPNEAEFRAYDILLSLNEGETLRLVKDIRKDVLKSPLVKSAFEAALAYKSHNYVKFFKLIDKATYLNSCILHRYIYDARISAMQVMVRAYSTQHHSTEYPISSIIRDLKFENAVEACSFCKWCSLSADETYVTIDRRTFIKPSSSLPVTRSLSLVGRKLNLPLGMIVNNESLPKNPLHEYFPHTSFDERHILKKESIIADDQQEPFKKIVVDLKVLQNERNNESFNKSPKDIHFLQGPKSTVPIKTNITLKENYLEVKEKPPFSFHVPYEKGENDKRECQKKKAQFSEAFQSPKIIFNQRNQIPFSFKSESQRNIPKSVSFKLTSSADTSTTSEIISHTVSVKNQQKDEFVASDNEKAASLLNLQNVPVSSSHYNEYSLDKVNKTPNNTFSFDDTKFSSGFELQKKCHLNKDKIDLRPRFFDFQNRENEELKLKNRKFPTDKLVPTNTDPAINFKDSSSQAEALQPHDTVLTVKRNDEHSLITKVPQLHELYSELVDELCFQYVEESLVTICEEVLVVELKRLIEMEDNMEELRINLAKKTFLKWKLFCERKIFRRLYENSAPNSPWVPMLINMEPAATIAVSPLSAYKKHCSLSRLAAEKIEKQNSPKPGWEVFDPDKTYNKRLRDLPSIYINKSKIKKFFKLVLVFPAVCDDPKISIFIDWICCKFGLSEVQNESNDSPVPLKFYCLNDGQTLISIRVIRLGLLLNSDYADFLNGISAMILCISESFSDYKDFRTNLEHFNSLLNADRLMYPYPLHIFFMASKGKYRITSHLSSFLNEKLDSGYFTCIKLQTVVDTTDFIENSKEVLYAINWLIENQKCFPHIFHSSVRHFLEDSFASAFNILYWKVSFDEFRALKMMPRHVIHFYNSVLSYKSSLLTSDLLVRVSMTWPPEELLMLCSDFQFINMKVQQEVKEFTKKIFLPKFKGNPDSEQDLFEYIDLVSTLASIDGQMLTMSIIRLLRDNPVIDWLAVLSKCAYCLLSSQSPKIPDDTISVYIMKDDLDTLDFDDLWQNIASDLKNINSDSIKRKFQSEETLDPKRKKIEWLISEPENFKEKYINDGYYDQDTSVPHSKGSEIEALLAPLQAALKKEKEEADSFECKLKSFSENSLFEGDKDDIRHGYKSVVRENTECSKNQNSAVFHEHETQKLLSPLNEKTSGISPVAGSSWEKYTPFRTAKTTSLSTIAEKLSDLQYNMQKNSILEENLSFLLTQ